jgi:Uma2 family endonuclease
MDNHLPPHLAVNVKGVMTTEQFEELCRANRDLRLELTSTGELIVMPPTGSRTGMRNFNLTGQLSVWVEKDGTGVGFDSSACFAMPDGSRLSPDASWVKRCRWEDLTEEEQEGFAPLCPDFVVEIRSRSDNVPPLQEKMLNYLTNGAAMAWLIDPLKRLVYIYRKDEPVVILEKPEFVTGDPLLPGFRLKMAGLW